MAEDAMTGVAIGMSLAGLRPIHVHIRMDFLMLAMNQLINMAAKSRYMYGGRCHDRRSHRHVPGRVETDSCPYPYGLLDAGDEPVDQHGGKEPIYVWRKMP